MNIHWLIAFQSVMRTGTITGAAAIMFRTQPQVSRMIAALEKALDLTLFEREGRRLIPTDEALRFLAHIDPIVTNVGRIKTIADDIRHKRDRPLLIAAEPFHMHALIPGAMETIPADSRTRFALDLCIRGLGVWMSRNTADIAVVGLPFSQTDMEARVFAEVSLVAVLPEGHPLAEYDRISIAQMRKERFIALRPSTLLRSQIDLAASHENVFFAPSVECASGPATCQLVANGVGITIADPIVASSFSMQRIVTRPLTKDIRLLYGILHYPDMALSEQACDFLDRLINTAFRLGGEQVHLPYPSNHAF